MSLVSITVIVTGTDRLLLIAPGLFLWTSARAIFSLTSPFTIWQIFILFFFLWIFFPFLLAPIIIRTFTIFSFCTAIFSISFLSLCALITVCCNGQKSIFFLISELIEIVERKPVTDPRWLSTLMTLFKESKINSRVTYLDKLFPCHFPPQHFESYCPFSP